MENCSHQDEGEHLRTEFIIFRMQQCRKKKTTRKQQLIKISSFP